MTKTLTTLLVLFFVALFIFKAASNLPPLPVDVMPTNVAQAISNAKANIRAIREHFMSNEEIIVSRNSW